MSEAPSSMPPDLWAGSQEGDSVAAVNPADLRNVWRLFRDAQARNPGQCTSVGNGGGEIGLGARGGGLEWWWRPAVLGLFVQPQTSAKHRHNTGPCDVVVRISSRLTC